MLSLYKDYLDAGANTVKDNFQACEDQGLRWEGGYSNQVDDPGGATSRGGITHINYDSWRKRHGLKKQNVKLITQEEISAIYREDYWIPAGCDDLPLGMDLCVFDAALNSGVSRAKQWLAEANAINPYCDRRLEFLKKTGKLWRVFGRGWSTRVAGIRATATTMAGQPTADPQSWGDLHAGMTGARVTALQTSLRALGYPCGAVDGTYGEQLRRAVILFQDDNELDGEKGIWFASYDAILKVAQPMLPKRKDVTRKDMEGAGDRPISLMNLIQRIFAWIFGASAVSQVVDANSVVDSINGARGIIEPLGGLKEFVASNWLIMVAIGCVGVIALIRLIRNEHVKAYQNFDYQGQAPAAPATVQGA